MGYFLSFLVVLIFILLVFPFIVVKGWKIFELYEDYLDWVIGIVKRNK